MRRIYKQGTLVYADTSVYGGVFDERFSKASSAFIELVRKGRFTLVVSPALEDELAPAPSRVLELYNELANGAIVVHGTSDIDVLLKAYLQHGILTPRWEADLMHVAAASVAGCKLLVSWNYKHIVHFERIKLYNAVNLTMGFEQLAIHAPDEVIYEE